MTIYLVGHPTYMKSNSMPRFKASIENSVRRRDIPIKVLQAKPILVNLVNWSPFLRKWIGYLDSYILFYCYLFCYSRIKINRKKDLVVFADQALGIYINIFEDYKHVVHCHDLLALRSAAGNYELNRTGEFGRIYQKLIYKGFSKASNFISVSNETKMELESLDIPGMKISEVVYNPLNYNFESNPTDFLKCHLRNLIPDSIIGDYVLSVSGGQWYKNTPAAIKLLSSYCEIQNTCINYVLVCSNVTTEIQQQIDNKSKLLNIYLLKGLSSEQLNALYVFSTFLLFPSVKEGFGWPIIEAFACGTNVLTTGVAPMSEIGSRYAHYFKGVIDVNNIGSDDIDVVDRVLNLVKESRFSRRELVEYSFNFNPEEIGLKYIEIYDRILNDD